MRKTSKYMRELCLFSSCKPLEFITIDVPGPLPKTKYGNRTIVVTMSRYKKLVRAVPTSKRTSTHAVKVFHENWILRQGGENIVLFDNASPFTRQGFAALCLFLRVKKLGTITYNNQSNGQIKRSKRSIINSLCIYILQHQKEWVTFIQSLTDAYNSQRHWLTEHTSFTLTP